MGEQPLASNNAYARTDRVGPLGGDDRKDGLEQRSSSRRRDVRIARRAVVNTDPASASEHNRSASKAVAQNGPSDLEPSDARDDEGESGAGPRDACPRVVGIVPTRSRP